MNLALDYDDTFTLDKEFWKEVILLARKYGHKTRIVTMRDEDKDGILEADELLKDFECPIIYCDGVAKKDITDREDYEVHVWIDDKPSGICEGSKYSKKELAVWRQEHEASRLDKTLQVAA